MAIRTLGTVRCLLIELVATAIAGALGSLLLGDLLLGDVLLGDVLLDPRRGPAPVPVADVLVAVCGWALLGCVLWAWVATSAVVLEALRGPVRGRAIGQPARPPRAVGLPGVPTRWRRLVLLACGVALSAGAVAPAHALPGPPTSSAAGPAEAGGAVGSAQALRGLPLPDRPTDQRGRGPATGWPGVPAPEPTAEPAPEPTAAPAAAATRAVRRVVVRPGDTLWSLARDDLPPADRASDAAVGAHWRVLHQLNSGVLGPDPDLIVPGQRLTLPPSAPSPHP